MRRLPLTRTLPGRLDGRWMRAQAPGAGEAQHLLIVEADFPNGSPMPGAPGTPAGAALMHFEVPGR